MRKPIAILLIALFAIALVFVIGPLFSDEPPPIITDTTQTSTDAVDAIGTGLDTNTPKAAGFEDSGRAKVHDKTEPELDPSIVAALAGFRGRVIDHNKQAVPDSLVKLYRFAADVVMNPNKTLFVEDGETPQPEIDAGEVLTDENGYFELTGVWPRAFYLLRAGQDQGSPTLRIVQRIPGPGEVVDLGDIQLIQCGILTGTVVDPDGEPVADALVRAVDLPGAVLTMVPLERIDPTGGLIVTEGGTQLVLQFPAWVKKRFEDLPIARTHTDSEGKFRLEGVPAGGNLVAITHPLWLSVVKPRVVVKAGKEKDLRRLRMGEGELVMGKVLDMEDKPIASAEIVVASANSMAPVHFASFAKPSAADGSFEFPGVPPKDIVVAARRNKGDPWVILEPQPATTDAIIHLPSEHEIHITLVSEIGEEIKTPRFQLTEGKRNRGAVEMAMWGATRPIDIKDRMTRTEEGVFVITGIPEGDYVLLAQAPGHAACATDISLKSTEEISINLPGQITFDVAVVDARGKPVRGADIYVQASGERPRLPDFPLNTGRTGKKGIVKVDQVQASNVRITAQHPAYGTSHASVTLPSPQPIVLALQDPGAIRGELTEGSAQPTPGKWTLTISRQWNSGGDRGAMPDLPRLVTPNLEGQFEVTGLKPGKYRVGVFTTLEMIKSPGKAMGLAETMFMMPDLPSRSVEVVSGQTAHINIDALEKKTVDGPSVLVTGTVILNGRIVKGLVVTGRSGRHRNRVDVDAQGRFNLGQMPLGKVNIEVVENTGSMFRGSRDKLYSHRHKLEEGKDLDLSIEITTTRAEGYVIDSSGNPVADARVQLQGQPMNSEGKPMGSIWRNEKSDKNGQFAFERIPTGSFTFSANNVGDGKGQSEQIVLDGSTPGTGIQIQLSRVYKVKGTVDIKALGEDKPKHMWLNVKSTEKGSGEGRGWGGVEDDGTFSVDDLLPGSYKVEIYANSSGDYRYVCDQILTVTNSDLEGLVLVLRREAKKKN